MTEQETSEEPVNPNWLGHVSLEDRAYSGSLFGNPRLLEERGLIQFVSASLDTPDDFYALTPEGKECYESYVLSFACGAF